MSFYHITENERLSKIKEKNNNIKEIFIKPIGRNNEELPKYKIYLTDSKIANEMGYIYFYVDFETYQSKFIGVKISPEFRQKKYANL